jgi:hypothetical protein
MTSDHTCPATTLLADVLAAMEFQGKHHDWAAHLAKAIRQAQQDGTPLTRDWYTHVRITRVTSN